MYIILYIFLFLVAIITYYLVIKPILRLLLLKLKHKDSINIYFFPVAGFFAKLGTKTKNNEDGFLYFLRGLTKDIDPKKQETHKLATVANLQNRIIYAFHDPQLVQEYLIQKAPLHFFNEPNQPLFDIVFSQGLATSNRKQHKSQRKLLSPYFHFQQLKERTPIVRKYVKILIQTIIDFEKENKGQDKYIHLLKINKQMTGSIITEMFFGEQFKEKKIEGENIIEYIYGVLEQILNNGITDVVGQLRGFILGHQITKKIPSFLLQNHEKINIKKVEKLTAVIQEEINKRIGEFEEREKQGVNDFLQIHLRQYFEDQRKSQKDVTDVTMEVIIHQFGNFLVAGIDTTAIFMANTLYYLAKYPDYQNTLRKEIDENLKGKSLEEIEIGDLANLKNLDNFGKEVLRCNPISNFLIPRQCERDIKIGPLQIKKGDIATVAITSNNNNKIGFKNPEKFDPDRWDSPEKTFDSYIFLPFSGGQKNCVGQHLAWQEQKISIINILKTFQVEMAKGKNMIQIGDFLNMPNIDDFIRFNKL